jgi:arsenate reductase-like glutaredoxin family protein
VSCGKTQGFLAKKKIVTVSQVDARKTELKKKEALELLRDVDELYVTKGRQVHHFNLKTDKPDTATLGELLIGRTGNLRAPTLRLGRTLVVGFDEETYKKLFG